MGVRFMLDWKWGSQIRSPFLPNQSTMHKQHSTSVQKRNLNSYERLHHLYAHIVRSGETSYESARAFILSATREDGETICKDSLKAYTSSLGALQVMETGSKELKTTFSKELHRAMYNQIDDIRMPIQDYASVSCHGLQVNEKSHYSLLYHNVQKIEEIFLHEDFVTLEKDILIQLGKLGALQLFQACLSRTLLEPTTIDYSTQLTKHPKDLMIAGETDNHVDKTVISSGKKDERRVRREKISDKAAKTFALGSSSKTIKLPRRAMGSTVGNSSKLKKRKYKLSRNEAEMSRGVKDVADLERMKKMLEVESGQVATFRCWAEAAGINEKVLQQRLHYGWFCRDMLLRSTHSLIVYLARNYRGLGISSEDLYQAGNVGVLKGAERFDHERGYQFSTYVQYWIRKEMSSFIEQHSREIHLPVTLSRRINQIKKARKTLYSLHGRYPDEAEISRFSGLSLAKIRFARKCPRIVGSVNQKIGDDLSAKFTEVTPDTSVESPEETVIRKHMQKDVCELLQGLLPRESKVLVLRYGFWDGQCKSLEEIARIFRCSKEWIRKIEKSALTKLRKEETGRNLNKYLKFLL